MASGAEAVAAVRQQAAAGTPYRIVFMDWKMPGMSGVERRARSSGDAREAPAIIMVTAFGREDVRQEAEEAGLDGFLVKPVSPSSLCRRDHPGVRARLGGGAAARPAAASGATALEGMKVLLAEDNEINQQIAIELLEAVGVTVEVAANGREAVDKVRSGTAWDAVLMDLQMPELDGIAATQAIRAEGRFGELPIIAMTAHAMVEERERCFAAGMNDHVTKPIEPDVLYQTLARWFQRRPAAETPVRAEKRPGAAEAALPQVRRRGHRIRPEARRRQPAALPQPARASSWRGRPPRPTRIRKALREGDRALAERVSHTLKGVSGNIGAAARASGCRGGRTRDPGRCGGRRADRRAGERTVRGRWDVARRAGGDGRRSGRGRSAGGAMPRMRSACCRSSKPTSRIPTARRPTTWQRTRRRCAPRSGPTASPASARRSKNTISETPSTGCGAPRRRKGNTMADALDFTEKQSILIVDDTPDNLTLDDGAAEGRLQDARWRTTASAR